MITLPSHDVDDELYIFNKQISKPGNIVPKLLFKSRSTAEFFNDIGKLSKLSLRLILLLSNAYCRTDR